MGLFSSGSVIGLYADETSATAVHVASKGNQASVLSQASISAGASQTEEGQEKKQRTLDSVKYVLSKANAQAKNVHLIIPGEGSIVRYFELPILPKKEEKSAVYFEAQKYVPFDLKEMYFDYETYPDMVRKKMGVVFFACRKVWTDSVCAMAELAGAKVSLVELVSQAVSRAAFRELPDASGKVYALVMANNEETAEIIIMKNGSTLATRHLPLSRAADTGRLDMPLLVSEIRISLDYFYDNFKGEKIEKLFLAMASEADTAALTEAASNELALSAESAHFFKKFSDKAPVLTDWVGAYGAALAGAVRTHKKINLRSGDAAAVATPVLSWPEERKQLEKIAVREIAALAAVLALLYVFLSGAAKSKERELEGLIAAYPQARVAGIAAPLSDLQAKDSQLMQRITLMSSLADKRPYLTLKLNEIPKIVPPNARLTQLSYSDLVDSKDGRSALSLHLEGFIFSTEAGAELSIVNRFASQLADNKSFMEGFSEVKVGPAKRVSVKGQPATRFILDCLAKKN